MTSQLWNNLSLIASLDKNKCKNNISQLLLDGKYVSDTKVMTDSFHKYFCSIDKNLQAKFNPYDNNAFTTYLSSPVKDSMFCD